MYGGIAVTTQSPGLPLHRTIVAIDIEGSTTRTNPGRGRLRNTMYDLLELAFQRSGIATRHRDDAVDRGDGALILIHPVDEVPKTVLLNRFVPALNEMLAEHQATDTDESFRLRVAIHAGEVLYDPRGPFGEAIDVTCRLLDAPKLKLRLRRTTAPLVVVVSDYLYRSVVTHGYDGIDERAFEPQVQVAVGGHQQRGWVSVPGDGIPILAATSPTKAFAAAKAAAISAYRRRFEELPFVEEMQA